MGAHLGALAHPDTKCLGVKLCEGGLGAGGSQREACPGGVLEVLSGPVGATYTKSTSGLMENPCFEKLADFSLRHVDMWWVCPMWPKCAFGDPKCPIRNKDMPFGNPPHHGTKNCGLLKNIDFFVYFYLLYVKKWCFWSQNGVLECFGPGVR